MDFRNIRWSYVFSILLLFLLPLHYLLFVIILGDITLFKYWKELDLVILFLLTVYPFRKINVKKITFNWTYLFIGLFTVVALYYSFTSSITMIALYHFRIYFEPFISYFIFKNLQIGAARYNKLCTGLFYLTIVLSIYGIIQSLILRPQFLVWLGYPNTDGRLGDVFFLSGFPDFQRVTSTFVYPNTFAYFLGMIIILIMFQTNKLKISMKITVAGLIVFGIAMFLTFSRSSWIGLLVVIALYGIGKLAKIKTLKKISFDKKFIFWGIGSVAVLGMLLYFLRNYGIIKMFFHYMHKTFSLSDTSAVGHIVSLNNSLSTIRDHPFGTGLGTNGPKALLNMAAPHLTESSYFLMIFEVGIIGAIFYFGVYLSILVRSIIRKRSSSSSMLKTFGTINCYLLVYSFTVFFFLPHIQDVETLVFLFSLLGLHENGFLIKEYEQLRR